MDDHDGMYYLISLFTHECGLKDNIQIQVVTDVCQSTFFICTLGDNVHRILLIQNKFDQIPSSPLMQRSRDGGQGCMRLRLYI